MPRSLPAVVTGLVSAALALGGVAPVAHALSPTAERAAAVERGDARDVLARVAALPGVTRVAERNAPRGYRFFVIDFTQPVDHRHPATGTFEQRLTLLHKSRARPMVMYTGGYNVYPHAWRSEPAQIVDGNQLSMEYRFFSPSRPEHPDWPTQLTIWQAAADQHKVITQFKRVYGKRWLTTGGSKGGMTATYHRRFFPDDVSGTVPYVAPNDADDAVDAYSAFLDEVGNDQQCRDDLTALQRRVLTDRSWFLQKAREASRERGLTYHLAGGLKVALEGSVVDMYFAFWQYSSQADCARVPDPVDATNRRVWNFYEFTSPLTGASDQGLRRYVPYYYQAASELGSPAPYEAHIGDLLLYPGTDVALNFVPDALKPIAFDQSAMADIDGWVSTESTKMLYIYGGNDPWGAEAFACGADAGRRQCARYVVRGGNHGAQIGDLPAAQRTHARSLVLRWAGLGAADQAVQRLAKTGSPRSEPLLDVPPDYVRRRPGR